MFAFDSNCLDSQALNEVLRAKISPSSRLILCASSGDAESVRFKLIDKGIKYAEIRLSNILDGIESKSFNRNLGQAGLPLYRDKEYLLTYAYRCYEEYKYNLPASALFSKSFSQEVYLVLILIAAFGKAELKHISCVLAHFDVEDFIQKHQRVFEIEFTAGNDRVLICNAPAWLIKTVRSFVDSDKNAYQYVSRVIISLEENGFSSLARDLIRFDKLNEISGGRSSRLFIKKLYAEIAQTYSEESHYWLQRSKAELISAQTGEEIEEGIRYARKVRLDNAETKNKTYYSGTLVLAQLLARGFNITGDQKYLISFIDPCIESIENYHNNRRHIDEMAAVRDVRKAIHHLFEKPIMEFLPRKEQLQRLFAFFNIREPKHGRAKT